MLANCFEGFFICRSRDGNVDDLSAVGDFSNDGFFRFHWKRGDGIYAGFDIVEQFAHISTRLEFDVDNTPVLRCRGGDALNAVETYHGFFDAYADGFFDFFGSSPQIDHGDIDYVTRKLWEDFHANAGYEKNTTSQDQYHQQIGCHAVSGKPFNGIFHFIPPVRTVRTRMPSTTVSSGDTQS